MVDRVGAELLQGGGQHETEQVQEEYDAESALQEVREAGWMEDF